MERLSKTVLSFALLALGGVPSVFSQTAEDATFERWVEYRNGEISLDFDGIPVYVALEAIRSKTGVDFVVPSATESEFVNLRLSRLQLEPAVRFLFLHIGVRSFALMYDGEGHPNRAVGLGVGSDRPEKLADGEASNSPKATAEQLTAEEEDMLLQELERWSDLGQEQRDRIEERLKTIPPSETRDRLAKEYGEQILGMTK